MKEIIFCSTNKWKIESLNFFFNTYNIKIKSFEFDIPESRSENNIEISKNKVDYAFKLVKNPVIAIDSWIYINSLNGFPSTFVNFTLKTIWILWIINLLLKKDRSCEIRNSLAFKDSIDNESIVFTEIIKWHISNIPKWELSKYNWSIFHKIFIPDWYNKTLAEMSENEYRKWEKNRINNWYLLKFVKFFINK